MSAVNIETRQVYVRPTVNITQGRFMSAVNIENQACLCKINHEYNMRQVYVRPVVNIEPRHVYVRQTVNIKLGRFISDQQ